MATDNNPRKTLSRLLHSDYFDAVSDYYLRDFIPNIHLHIQKCQHRKCRYYKRLEDGNRLSMSSFRFNEQYITFLTNLQ